jgi:23S rRNA pseudouridine2605 synthase
VLGHLGLGVTRLIRVSFGPFQLGELAQGAVEEVRTRVLREQLGDKLVRLSGADFSTPPPTAPRKPRHDEPRQDETRQKETRPIAQQKPERPKRRTASDHAWRVHEEGRPTKKLRRRFRGTRSDRRQNLARDERPQTDTLTDRKGRPVVVDKYLQTAPTEAVRQDLRKDDRGFRGKSEQRRRGKRPARPRSGPPRRGKH